MKGIQMIPTLHRNTISFMGMRKTSHYLSMKRKKDQYLALDKYGVIKTWSLTTGKLIYSYDVLQSIGINFSDYEICKCQKEDFTY